MVRAATSVKGFLLSVWRVLHIVMVMSVRLPVSSRESLAEFRRYLIVNFMSSESSSNSCFNSLQLVIPAWQIHGFMKLQ